jgi:hypothetical protein
VTQRYNVFIREHQIVRFSIEVETDQDLHAVIVEARKRYERSGAELSAHAETEIDDTHIFAVDELDPANGSIRRSYDFESVSASVGEPIDLST